MIEFLQDYRTEALPPETFKKGEQVKRGETSERYFVGRGLAGYVIDGKLVDADLRPITVETVTVEIVRPGERATVLAGRGGEVMTGQPPRATSGPGVPFVEATTGVAGTPPVVLEAEVDRLKAALETGNDLFRDMNNSHVEAADALRIDVDRLTKELSLAGDRIEEVEKARDQARDALKDLRSQHEGLVLEYQAAQKQVDTGAARIAELEGLLAEANKPDGKPSRTPK